MPIITTDKVKELLQITGTTYDVLIASLIPLAQNRISEYCGTIFNTHNFLYDSFVFNATAKTITANDSFEDVHIIPGDIYISGTYNNDGFKVVESVTGNQLTLKTGEAIVDEDDNSNSALITLVKFPTGIEISVASYIQHLMNKQGKLVESESLPGGYSVKYKDTDTIMKELFKDYRKLTL